MASFADAGAAAAAPLRQLSAGTQSTLRQLSAQRGVPEPELRREISEDGVELLQQALAYADGAPAPLGAGDMCFAPWSGDPAAGAVFPAEVVRMLSGGDKARVLYVEYGEYATVDALALVRRSEDVPEVAAAGQDPWGGSAGVAAAAADFSAVGGAGGGGGGGGGGHRNSGRAGGGGSGGNSKHIYSSKHVRAKEALAQASRGKIKTGPQSSTRGKKGKKSKHKKQGNMGGRWR